MTRMAPIGESVSQATVAMSDKDFERIAKFALVQFGLSLPNTKKSLVHSRVIKRLRAHRLPDFGSYCALIESPQGAGEMTELLSALTTNVTRFFREDHHFSHLRADVLPKLIENARSGGRVRIWSAGCSSGQEPYSLAMMLLAEAPDLGKRNVKILATDIDPAIVEKATAGVYGGDEREHLPKAMQSRPMIEDGPLPGSFAVGRPVRDLVTFGIVNLIADLPMSGPFDVIFCRNVAIYFDKPTQEKVWQRFADLLAPGGYLYIGHSERVSGSASAQLKSAGITIYRKDPAARQASPVAAKSVN
jgi:chemotaxis protein methyltransferase CheR